MGRDGQLANCDPDGQKIGKARDTYGARCDAVCLEEGQLVVYKRAAKFYARVAEEIHLAVLEDSRPRLGKKSRAQTIF